MTDSRTDYELVKDFISGDESAFNKLAMRYQEKIYWHARRMLGNHLDADEVVQQVLLVMYKKLKSFKFQSSLYTWIYKITATRSLNLIKKNKIKTLLSLDDQITDSTVSGNDIIKNIEEKERLDNVNKMLQKIPPKQREVFILRNYDQLSYEEISEITGKSVGALKANYFHAFKKLKELLDEKGE